MIRYNQFAVALLGAAVLLFPGCNKQADTKAEFTSAINDYYKAHPVCIWQDTKKMPVQAATADDSKTAGYDALTDAGLLTRTTAEKKVFIIASKQVNNYDLSDQGRSAWTPDSTQPGYGNFCYGHRNVDSIDSFTTGVNGSGVKNAEVNYHYSLTDVPGWAKSQEVQTAFPSLAATLAHSQQGQDALVLNGNNWQVSK
ncbi:MAG TPA: hypothetical protein VMB49_17260 [Acidobacteriaceae bacterium]|nr:hypothetical protein [Acidobacteriaceae bacterium]